MIKYAGGSE
jgi:hypothetical protein